LSASTIVWAAVGITTNFVGLSPLSVEAGKTVDVCAAVGRPLEVRNGGERPVRVRLEAEPAPPAQLLTGHDPMPAPAWVRIEPSELVVPAGGVAAARVYLTVPDAPRWRGRKLQGALWIRTVGKSMTQVGLRTKLPFVVAGEAAADAAPGESDRPVYTLRLDDVFDFGPDAQEVGIYQGRRDRVYHARRGAGEKASLTWNCRDEKGTLVPVGNYLAEVRRAGGRVLFLNLSIVQ